MIMTVIPVIPPDLRPMVQLDGGACRGLNDGEKEPARRKGSHPEALPVGRAVWCPIIRAAGWRTYEQA